MTVQELIEKLQEYPPNAVVVFRCCSDFQALDPTDLKLQSQQKELTPGDVVAHHNIPGAFREFRGSWEYENKHSGVKLPLPNPVDAVIFPGN